MSARKEKTFSSFKWIDFVNPGKPELKELASEFLLDINLVNDSLQHGHLPKLEKLEKYTFIILRSFTALAGDRITKHSEISNKIAFFLKEDLLITIHRKEFSFLSIEKPDYQHPQELFLDIAFEMVHSFDAPLKNQADRIDQFERTLFLKKSSQISLEDLYFQKIKARIGRKLLILTQNVLNQFDIKQSYQTRLQDIRDKLTHSILTYDEIMDDSLNLLNTYLSITTQRSNDVMKLLTVFSAFFLPLTFIVGVYGMNFDNMPELKWPKGYFLSLGLMATVVIVIYFWFKRRKIL
ncbi:MAG: hypothetical protein IPM34_00665 [Saprospiraceae bacterium]|nr:hypothetical protein [Saprospiraceae bacterium]